MGFYHLPVCGSLQLTPRVGANIGFSIITVRFSASTHAPMRWGERALIPLEQRYKWLQLAPTRGGAPRWPAYTPAGSHCTHAPGGANGQSTGATPGPEELQLTPPSGGQTIFSQTYLRASTSFNSRPGWGQMPMRVLLPTPEPALQLTPPRGDELCLLIA